MASCQICLFSFGRDAAMDQLVTLFLQSAGLSSDAPGVRPSPEAIERGIQGIEVMMSSREALSFLGSATAPLVLLALALEEKPCLEDAAIQCYAKTVELLRGERRGHWERCVVLQQVGKVCLKHGQHRQALVWLNRCAEELLEATGHPKNMTLFAGAFKTQQTMAEFGATLEKLRAKSYMDLGDEEKCRYHYLEARRLEEAFNGDAVQRVEALSGNKVSGVGDLWSVHASDERALTEYRYTDEGSTVLLILDLKDHLGLDEALSHTVALQHFRVDCTNRSVVVRFRVRNADSVQESVLRLTPLAREIVPQDTVPRLRGCAGRRRLEVKLFKEDKGLPWAGDFVASTGRGNSVKPEKVPSPAPVKGTLLNPLSPEELAALPTPSGGRCDNRPSRWRDERVPATSSTAPLTHTQVREGVGAERMSAPDTTGQQSAQSEQPVGRCKSATHPRWISHLEWREGLESLELLVRLCDGERALGMVDFDLDAHCDLGVRLALRGEADELTMPLPSGTLASAMTARWRRKARTLELKFPCI